MKRSAMLVPLALAAVFAGFATAPAAPPPAETAAVARSVAPVAVMRVVGQKPLINGKWRYTFSGTTSYDPDGTISSYYWYPQAWCRLDGAYGTTYYMDIPEGESCGLTLTVTDNSGDTDSEVRYFIGGEDYM